MKSRLKLSNVVLAAFLALTMSSMSYAEDYPNDAPERIQSMPVLGPGEYGTDTDNENNAGTGVADGDMDTYLFNTSSVHPIEFNIFLPDDPTNMVGTLVMNVYDIDSPDEVDNVYINDVKVGTLTGSTNVWGMNRFTIPVGILTQGDNLVRIDVDVNDEGWATTIDYAYISGLNAASGGITRCWVAPVKIQAGEYVNFFAEISGTPTAVLLYSGDMLALDGGKIVELTDPDGDQVYSAQFRVPLYTRLGNTWLHNFKVRAVGAWGHDWCPGIKIR